MSTAIPRSIKAAARRLAEDNAAAEPSISEVWLFPSDSEIRLVEFDDVAAPSDGSLRPIYFGADPEAGIPFPSGIAIAPKSEGRAAMPPPDWGSWKNAVRIYPASNGN